MRICCLQKYQHCWCNNEKTGRLCQWLAEQDKRSYSWDGHGETKSRIAVVQRDAAVGIVVVNWYWTVSLLSVVVFSPPFLCILLLVYVFMVALSDHKRPIKRTFFHMHIAEVSSTEVLRVGSTSGATVAYVSNIDVFKVSANIVLLS